MRQITLPKKMPDNYQITGMGYLDQATLVLTGNGFSVTAAGEDKESVWIWDGKNFRSVPSTYSTYLRLLRVGGKMVVRVDRYNSRIKSPQWYSWPHWKKVEDPFDPPLGDDPSGADDEVDDNSPRQKEWDEYRKKESAARITSAIRYASSDRFFICSAGLSNWLERIAGPTEANKILSMPEVSGSDRDGDRDDYHFVIYDRYNRSCKLMEVPKTPAMTKKGKIGRKLEGRPFHLFAVAPDGLTFAAATYHHVFVYDLEV